MLHPSVLPVIGVPRGYNLYQYTGNIGQKNMRTSSTCLWCRATCLPIFFELPPFQALAANIEASLRRLSRSSHRSFSLAGTLSLAKPISLVDVPCESSEGTKAIPWRFAAVGRLRLAQHSSHFVAEKAGVQEDDGSPGYSYTFLGKRAVLRRRLLTIQSNLPSSGLIYFETAQKYKVKGIVYLRPDCVQA